MYGPRIKSVGDAKDFLAAAQFMLLAPGFRHPVTAWSSAIFAGLTAAVEELRREIEGVTIQGPSHRA